MVTYLKKYDGKVRLKVCFENPDASLWAWYFFMHSMTHFFEKQFDILSPSFNP